MTTPLGHSIRKGERMPTELMQRETAGVTVAAILDGGTVTIHVTDPDGEHDFTPDQDSVMHAFHHPYSGRYLLGDPFKKAYASIPEDDDEDEDDNAPPLDPNDLLPGASA